MIEYFPMTNKEVFLSSEEALKRKKQEVTKEKIKGNLLRVGGYGIIGGIVLLITEFANDQNPLIIAGSLILGAGLATTTMTEGDKALSNARLISKEIDEIQESMTDKSPTVKQESH